MTSIKEAVAADLKAIALCHQKAFPKALSSAMGTGYLCKMLEWYLVDKRSFLFFIEEHGICCGYCGGLKFGDGASLAGSTSSMIQHSFREGVRTFLMRPWLFLHPEFIPKYKLAARNVLRRLKFKSAGVVLSTRAAKDTSLPKPHTGLIVIGVDPNFQGKGYGSRLLREFERVSHSFGFKLLSLTVKTGNLKAINSYRRNGWITTEVNGNSTTMEKHLS